MTAPRITPSKSALAGGVPVITGPAARRRFMVSLPADVSYPVLVRLGAVLEPGHLPVIEIEAENRAEAREIATEMVAEAQELPVISALPTATAAQLADQATYRTAYGRR